MTAHRPAPRRIARIALRIAVVAGCLAYAFWDVQLVQLEAIVRRYDPARLLAALGFTALAYLVLAARFRALVHGSGQPVSLRRACQASVFGLGMNNLLPARLGEIAKVVYLRNRAGLDFARLLGTVFWERFADMHALLVLALVIVVLIDQTRALGPLLGLVAVGWASIIVLRRDPGWVNRLVGHIPHPPSQRFVADLAVHLRTPLGGRGAAALSGWTVLVWLAYVAQVFVTVSWVAGIPVAPAEVLVVFLVATLGMALPVSPGGLGVYESLFVLSLGWFGVAPEEALAAGLTAHMLQYIPTTVFAVIELIRTGGARRSVVPLTPLDQRPVP